MAALAAEGLDELDVERAVFLGFSWGATVGCWLAALHPERTLALALVEGGHLYFADLSGFRADRPLDELISEAENVEAREGPAFGSHTPAVAGAMVYGLCREPATDTYSRIATAATPTLFVGSGQTEAAGSVERLARLVPQPSPCTSRRRDTTFSATRRGPWPTRSATGSPDYRCARTIEPARRARVAQPERRARAPAPARVLRRLRAACLGP